MSIVQCFLNKSAFVIIYLAIGLLICLEFCLFENGIAIVLLSSEQFYIFFVHLYINLGLSLVFGIDASIILAIVLIIYIFFLLSLFFVGITISSGRFS
jgi:hypothetical protein